MTSKNFQVSWLHKGLKLSFPTFQEYPFQANESAIAYGSGAMKYRHGHRLALSIFHMSRKQAFTQGTVNRDFQLEAQ